MKVRSGMGRMIGCEWALTWGKELHVEDEVVHLLGGALSVLVIPSQTECLNMLLLEGVSAFHHTADSLPPILLGTIIQCAGVGTSVDELSERRIAERGRDSLVFLEELLAKFEAKIAAHVLLESTFS